jgi:acyl-CoA synthetase (AMP-forming)/AMP-acid ligase II
MISESDPDATIPRLVRARATQFADEEAVVDGALRKSFSELAADALDFTRSMLASGVQPGDRVGLWAPNSYRWIVAALGTVSAGAVLVPINTRYKGDETRYLLAKTSARALITEDGFLGNEYIEALADKEPDPNGLFSRELPHLATVVNLADESTSFRSAVVGWDAFGERARGVRAKEAIEVGEAVKPDQLSDLIFTSGTTGKPKGAMLCHGQTLREYEAWSEPTGLRAGDRYLIVNPFFHAFGYKAGILACLIRGATIVPQRTLDVATALGVIETERITVLTGPPTLYTSILDHPDRSRFDLSSLRVAVTGAAVVPVSMLDRMRKEMTFTTILTAYGLTESGGTVSICLPDDSNETVSQTSGKAIPDTEIRIVDEKGLELAPGEAGEILVRGYGVMKGYFEDEAETAQAIDDEGWLHTGDIGVLDERGYLRITDRLKDMFIVGGFNAYPAEIEQVLLSNEAIAQAAVIGVPDERMGEVGRAFVVLRPGHRASEAEIVAFCQARLANFKVPRSVSFEEDLPRNASGKVLKNELRALT